MEKYSLGSRVVEGVEAEITRDRGLRARREKLISLGTGSQEQTPEWRLDFRSAREKY
jgi:hypothetical protein